MSPELRVGIETADDAVVYQLTDEIALIGTQSATCSRCYIATVSRRRPRSAGSSRPAATTSG